MASDLRVRPRNPVDRRRLTKGIGVVLEDSNELLTDELPRENDSLLESDLEHESEVTRKGCCERVTHLAQRMLGAISSTCFRS